MLGIFTGEPLTDAVAKAFVNAGKRLIDGFQFAPHGFRNLSPGAAFNVWVSPGGSAGP